MQLPETNHTDCWVIFIHMIFETWFLLISTTLSQPQHNYILRTNTTFNEPWWHLIGEFRSDSPCSSFLSIQQITSHDSIIQKLDISKPCSLDDENPSHPKHHSFPFFMIQPKILRHGHVRQWTLDFVILSNFFDFESKKTKT